MKITRWIAPLTFALSFACCTLAPAAEEQTVIITELFRRDHPDIADKEIIVKRIELKPGAAAPAHVHPGMVTGYIETGKLEFQLKGEPLKSLKTGDTFFEPAGSHHLVARNPDPAAKTVIIAFVVNPKGAPLSTPLEHEPPKR